MGSQFHNTSLLKCNEFSIKNVLYSWKSENTSPLKSSMICMSMSSSVRPSTNTSDNIALEEIKDHTSTLLSTNSMPLIQDNGSLFVDQHEQKFIPPSVDIRINKLKEYTRRALTKTVDPKTTLKLIDTIQRLGVGYYFEKEINEILVKLTQVLHDDDLYTMALHFRLKRQNGLHANPEEVFKKFMDAKGKLKSSSLGEDKEGLLSLYEASYLSARGEDFLSHAKEITPQYLCKVSPKHDKKVVEGLKLPGHMRMERLEARRYIEEYGNEDDYNPLVLEFAKLDYNQVQSQLQMELMEVDRWWQDLGLGSELSFVRDRHVECFMWSIGVLPDPNFSGFRIELAKVIAILLVIDDIYDTYGSYNDLLLFTKAIQRWDLNEMRQLPRYMNICYMALYSTHSEICYKILKERGLIVHPFLHKTWIDLVEAYMVEVEWMKRGIIPNLKDYIANGVTSSGSCMAMVHLFLLISEGVTEENIRDLLHPYPNFFILAGTILRLWDDLGTTKEEQERGNVLSSIQLLMKEKNITCEEEARKQILQLIHSSWTELNVALVEPDVMLLPIIKVALNMARASQVVYQHNEDSYLSSVKSQVQSLFFKPIDI